MLKQIFVTTAIMALGAATSAHAAAYVFNVDYSGNGVAALAAGSDDLLSVALTTGDTFVYNLTATGSGQWSTISSGAAFPFFALYGDYGASANLSSNVIFTLDLNENGVSVFQFGETTTNCCAHLGTNTVSLPQGLVFNQFSLAVQIVSTQNTGPAFSLLPFAGNSPETYSPALIAYSTGTSATPEPGSWALMIAGFGMVGASIRRLRGYATA